MQPIGVILAEQSWLCIYHSKLQAQWFDFLLSLFITGVEKKHDFTDLSKVALEKLNM